MTTPAFSVNRLLSEFAQSLKSVKAVEAVGVALAAVGIQFGLPDLIITDLNAVTLTPALAILFSMRPREDLTAYLAAHPPADNPVLTRSWASEEPCLFSEIKNELHLSEGELSALMQPWAHDREGLSVNVEAAGRRLNFAYGGETSGVDPAARSVLFVAAALAGERLTELQQGAGNQPKLTKRERAVLEAVAGGKSDTEISETLDIAERTVRFHVENAKRKLGIATRAQAVLMVLRGDVT